MNSECNQGEKVQPAHFGGQQWGDCNGLFESLLVDGNPHFTKMKTFKSQTLFKHHIAIGLLLVMLNSNSTVFTEFIWTEDTHEISVVVLTINEYVDEVCWPWSAIFSCVSRTLTGTSTGHTPGAIPKVAPTFLTILFRTQEWKTKIGPTEPIL